MVVFINKEEICSRTDQRKGLQSTYKVAKRHIKAESGEKTFPASGVIPQRDQLSWEVVSSPAPKSLSIT